MPARSPARPAPQIDDQDNWDQRLGFLMHDVSRLRRSVFNEFMKPLGVTRSQWWVLAHLSRHDGMIQTDLANVLELGKAPLGGLLDRLELSGLVERRSDPADRRAKRIFLSARGLELIAHMSRQSHAMSERMLEGLGPAARVALADLLMKVKRNLVALKAEESPGAADAAQS
ncbi:MarR family transcriptional regulator [Variovorax sp. dw_954]|uniref:MarR family winged helix-turn-helix transcriptional regulator n=1 Tax=Variovorax sp. dw_954 TaxID=2720078 RepID=UPI001BD52EA1|nr:MarR family transcriptional regulator [Variovorax sp. dw_954]